MRLLYVDLLGGICSKRTQIGNVRYSYKKEKSGKDRQYQQQHGLQEKHWHLFFILLFEGKGINITQKLQLST